MNIHTYTHTRNGAQAKCAPFLFLRRAERALSRIYIFILYLYVRAPCENMLLGAKV